MNIVADSAIPFIARIFNSSGNIVLLDTHEITRSNIKDADVLVVRSVTCVNENLLAGTEIKIVVCPASGIDHIDLSYLHSVGIKLINTPGCNACSVAEYVLSSLFALQKKQFIKLSEIRVGLIGCGHVGSYVFSLLDAIGIKVLLYDPPLQAAGDSREFSTLQEIQKADVISLHVPLKTAGENSTYQLVDHDFLSEIKPGAVIINTSRGEVIDEKALLDILEHDHGCNVVIDVWKDEPDINQELLSRAILSTPHIAGYSIDAKYRGTLWAYEKLCEMLCIEKCVPAEDLIPQLKENQLNIPDVLDDNEVIQFAVLSGYDMEADSDVFKQLLTKDEKIAGQFFSELRRHYPLRREFTYFTVSLPASKIRCKKRLEDLGFNVMLTD